jgi:hypothetical protein
MEYYQDMNLKRDKLRVFFDHENQIRASVN